MRRREQSDRDDRPHRPTLGVLSLGLAPIPIVGRIDTRGRIVWTLDADQHVAERFVGRQPEIN